MVLQVVTIISLAVAAVFGAVAWRLSQQERLRSAVRVAALADAIDGAPPERAAIGVQAGFLAHERAAGGRGVLKIAVLFAIAVAAIIALATLGSSHRSAAAVTPPTKDASLELLSMKPEHIGSTLTVTGLVRNGGSVPAQRLIAVVFAFDHAGNFIASGRAPLDFVTLAAGDDSPFRVSVPNVADVDRYRVSFRTEQGVVRHVDRRQQLLAKR